MRAARQVLFALSLLWGLTQNILAQTSRFEAHAECGWQHRPLSRAEGPTRERRKLAGDRAGQGILRHS